MAYFFVFHLAGLIYGEIRLQIVTYVYFFSNMNFVGSIGVQREGGGLADPPPQKTPKKNRKSEAKHIMKKE